MSDAYTDAYLSGPPEVIESILALNAGLDATPTRVLDGVMHVLIRRPTSGAPLAVPEGVLLDTLTVTPETAQMAVGVFMSGPEPL